MSIDLKGDARRGCTGCNNIIAPPLLCAIYVGDCAVLLLARDLGICLTLHVSYLRIASTS